MVYHGAGARIGFKRESTFGSQPASFASTARFLGITNAGVSLPDKNVEIRQYRSFGQGRDGFFAQKPGRHDRRGNISFLPTTGELLYYAFGADSFTAGSPNTHVLTPDNVARLPSMTFALDLDGTNATPDFARRYTGTCVDNLSLSLAEGGELQASMSFISTGVDDEGAASPTLLTQPTTDGSANSAPIPYMFNDRIADVSIGGTYTQSTDTYDLTANSNAGRTVAQVRSFNWSISNNLKPLYATRSSNSQDPFTIVTSYPTYSLSMEIVPSGKLSTDTSAIYDLLEGETKFDVLIPMRRSASDRMDFIFYDCFISSAPHNPPEDGSEMSVPVTVSPRRCQVVVRDSLATYSGL